MSNTIDRCCEPTIVGLTLNYRDVERTSRCIANLLEQGVTHILVWDNSEDDGHSATTLSGQWLGEKRVSIEISSKNLGFAAGVNCGLAWIRARFPKVWVLLINNDAFLQPGALHALVGMLTKTPQAVLAYPTIEHQNEQVATLYYQCVLALVTRKRLPGSIPYASGCCQLLAPERQEGAWFDEDFFMYGEDVELSFRLGKDRMVHVPQALVIHEGSASSGMATPFYETHISAEHWRLARKLARNRIEHTVFVAGRILSLQVRALLRAWRYRSIVPLIALLDGIRLAAHRPDVRLARLP